ncbi:MAG: hypothetical protein PHI48_06335 [Bacteroidales bacterium]|nr:hypothetical protein [Bacteroidales bacterium]
MIEEKEIKNCIRGINKRLEDKRINRFCNAAVKAGYIKSLEILKKRTCNYEDANIKELPSTQSRAIAVLAVDFLNGECTESVLLGVPISMKDTPINVNALIEYGQQSTGLKVAYYSNQMTIESYIERLTQLSIESAIKALEPIKREEISDSIITTILFNIDNKTCWDVFCYINDHYKLTKQAQAEGLKYSWVNGRADVRALSLFSKVPPKLIMDEEENKKYMEMPDIIRIYRGCHKDEADFENGNFFGFSWTYNREIAEFFAFRDCTHTKEDGRVFSVTIPKDYIYAIILDRDEDEVIFDFQTHFEDPNKAEIITEVPTSYYDNFLIRKNGNK